MAGISDRTRADENRGMSVVYGQPTAEELAAVVAVLLLAGRDPADAAPPTGRTRAGDAPGWLRGPYSAPNAWTVGP